MASLVPDARSAILAHRLLDPVTLDPLAALDDQIDHPALPDNDPSAHPSAHPLIAGQILYSPGCHFAYRVLGPCCRLFDREQLPWPSCRLEWHSKEPSWRRVGKRYVVDMATQHSPSYSVEIIGQRGDPLVITLYGVKLSPERKEWWYSRRLVKRLKVPDDLSSGDT
jgi:hypothetical protein